MTFMNPSTSAVLFDMDGVLIDSEPLWKVAMHEVFTPLGSHLTPQDFQQTVGLRIDQVVHYWNVSQGWNVKSEAAVVQAILDRMVALVRENPYALTGVYETLQYLQERGIPTGVATSSPTVLMDAVLDALELRPYFQTVQSAEHLAYGKPHPEVYLRAAEALQRKPQHCWVIEDSLNGVISGKAAGMQVICIPEKTHHPNPKLIVADHQYASLLELLDAWKTLDK
jgi:sugar-phosphatase